MGRKELAWVALTRLKRKDRGEWGVRQRFAKHKWLPLRLVLLVLPSILIRLLIWYLAAVWHPAILATGELICHVEKRGRSFASQHPQSRAHSARRSRS